MIIYLRLVGLCNGVALGTFQRVLFQKYFRIVITLCKPYTDYIIHFINIFNTILLMPQSSVPPGSLP